MKIIGAINETLKEILLEAGNRTIVLLEGEDDLFVFKEIWQKSKLDEYYFHDCNGHVNLKSIFDDLLLISKKKNFFGIRDRDFDFKENEVTKINKQKKPIIYIASKNTLENYFVKSDAFLNVHKIKFGINKNKKSKQDYQLIIDKTYNNLKLISAAIIAIIEINSKIKEQDTTLKQIEFFSECDDRYKTSLDEISIFIQTKLPNGFNINVKKIISKHFQKLNKITDNDKLDKYIQGKRILCYIFKENNLGHKIEEFNRQIAMHIEFPIEFKNFFS